MAQAVDFGLNEEIKYRALEALKKVMDPEMGLNVVDLGLVRDVSVAEGPVVQLEMILTFPGCPLASMIMTWAKKSISDAVPEAKEVQVELVTSPPWTPLDMTKEGRDELKRRLGYDPVEMYLKTHGAGKRQV